MKFYNESEYRKSSKPLTGLRLSKVKRRIRRLKDKDMFFFVMTYNAYENNATISAIKQLRQLCMDTEVSMSATQLNNPLTNFYYIIAFKKTSTN